MSKPFSIDLGGLRSRSKETGTSALAKADAAGEAHGFLPREPHGRPGRKPSPRTGQVHAKVLPHVSDEIADEARRRGVTQGVLIEEAWTLYLAQSVKQG
jgi:hypothetical protein